MNKQELLGVLSKQITKEEKKAQETIDDSNWINGYSCGRVDALEFGYKKAEWLNESEKPKIPRWLAERIEEYYIDSSIEFWRYFFNGDIFNPINGERDWILDNDELISKIFLYGYTIEKEPVWVVKDDDMYLISLSVLYDGVRVNSYFHVLDENFDRPRVFRNKEEAEAARILAAKGTVEEWSEDND
ncbi:hypothetical protein TMUPMC115_0232 [Tetragenococcus muriaticus PMC-11-5]|uniref:Uncharacterized protein n=1 Tax=Tetragenococcus muriaticus PMC-11-5 TaxID=1302649 RepID=A0A091C989_9ENTE|nr:hypothetical protein [Tetragenococcus muriaticus]KFN93634.1 hypothetical protein TMUPMC115_0232 [Tetragenococcus muriaticus PMC-11-5]